MQKMAPSVELDAVDLDGEAEKDLSLHQEPGPLFGHVPRAISLNVMEMRLSFFRLRPVWSMIGMRKRGTPVLCSVPLPSATDTTSVMCPPT